MNQTTKTVLNDLNKKFYDANSSTFDATRQSPWNGWEHLLPYLKTEQKHLKILDIGCGNGRFAQFIDQKNSSYEYTGIDFSSDLLKYAQSTKKPNIQFKAYDILNFNPLDFSSSYNFITLFGVMHHIPGHDTRKKLIGDVIKLLNSSGILVVSFWKFAEFSRFQKKYIDWSTLSGEISRDIEEHDYLLGWQDTQVPRYCHFASDIEVKKLFENQNGTVIADFRADGKEKNLNQYIVFQKHL